MEERLKVSLLEVLMIQCYFELEFLHNFAEVSKLVRRNHDLNLHSNSSNVIPEAVLKMNRVSNQHGELF